MKFKIITSIKCKLYKVKFAGGEVKMLVAVIRPVIPACFTEAITVKLYPLT